jgi:hypothetical protein
VFYITLPTKFIKMLNPHDKKNKKSPEKATNRKHLRLQVSKYPWSWQVCGFNSLLHFNGF